MLNQLPFKGTGLRKRVSLRRAEQNEAGPNVLTVKAVDGGLSIIRVGQECKAVACDLSVLPLDDDIVSRDGEFSILEELDNLFWGHLPWQSSHLDSSVSVAFIEGVSQRDVFVLRPIIRVVN